MSKLSELEAEARNFAGEVTDLLNRTVANGIRLSAVLHAQHNTCVVAKGITKRSLRPESIPLTLSAKKARAHLLVAYLLDWDPEGVHPAVLKSEYAIYAGPGLDEMVCHFDYERNPSHRYPEAHFQVAGTSEAFAAASGPDTPTELRDVHFPVGGRRFRPSLEDVVEFLVVEGFADGRSGWDTAVVEHRDRWHQRQLAAAVRRFPEVAAAQLSDDGWNVTPPPSAI